MHFSWSMSQPENWSPNSMDLNSVDYSVRGHCNIWCIVTKISDIDHLKHMPNYWDYWAQLSKHPLTDWSISCQTDWWWLSRRWVPVLNFIWTCVLKCLQWFGAVGLAAGRASTCKNWVVGAGVVICLEHMAQLMPLPLTVSCFSTIQIVFTFLVPARLGSPRQWAVKQVCVCVC